MDNKQQELNASEHEIEQRIDMLQLELDKIDAEIKKLRVAKHQLEDALSLVKLVTGGNHG
tara:strand:- start:338 stop:517 length:180 start_codon:yes stop_codon:yes gene_type:complete